MSKILVDFTHKYNKNQMDDMFCSVSMERQKKAEAKKNEAYAQSILAGYMLETAFCQMGYEPPFSYCYSDNKKPRLLGIEESFSISHSHECVVVAISNHTIGADVEYTKRDITDRLSHSRFLRKEERRWFAEDKMRFFYLWTFKEALAKALDMPLFDVLAICKYPTDTVCDLSEGEISFEIREKNKKFLVQQRQILSKEYILTVCEEI